MIIKYAIANITPEALATMGQKEGIHGSVYYGLGFGQWGIEPTAFLEVAVASEDSIAHTDKFVRKVLFQQSEESAYRTVDGRDAGLLHVTGRFESIYS